MAKDDFNQVSGPKVLLPLVEAVPTKFTAHLKTDKRGKEIKTEEDLATATIRAHDASMMTVRGGKIIAISPPKNKL